MHAVRRWGGLAAAVTPVMVAATLACPASAALAAPTPRPAPASSGTAGTPEPARLTPAQVKAQIAAADALRSRLTASSAAMAAATRRLEQLATQSSGLLARLAAARDAERAAAAETAAQQRRLRLLAVQVAAEKTRLGHWAHDSYVSGGGSLSNLAATMQLLTSSSPQDSSDGLAVLGYLADEQGRAYDHLKALLAAQDDATARAAAAAKRAQHAAGVALAAKTALDRSVAQQRAALKRVRAAQAAEVTRAGGLRGDLLRSGSASARAADKRLAKALRANGGPAGAKAGADCSPGDTRDYPNGKVPASALCPMYGSADERLREDPARGFNAMSRAYEHDTGSPLCVTDGYRPLGEQVEVARATPNLAARPGTSHHGLGIAADLCGGVQSFGTSAHLWMQHNAPLFGWYHPAWAEPSGSMPEPWHWEYAG
jgi:D-alanyl-D-alanine carboxypeptidase